MQLVERSLGVRDILENAGDEHDGRVVGDPRDRPRGQVGGLHDAAHGAAVEVDAQVAAVVGPHKAGVRAGVWVAHDDERTAELGRSPGRGREGPAATLEATERDATLGEQDAPEGQTREGLEAHHGDFRFLSLAVFGVAGCLRFNAALRASAHVA